MDEIRALDAEVLAVSADPVAAGRRLAADAGLDLRLLSDPDRQVIAAYGVRHPGAGIDGGDVARPATFILDRAGVVRFRELTANIRVRVRPQRIVDELAKIP